MSVFSSGPSFPRFVRRIFALLAVAFHCLRETGKKAGVRAVKANGFRFRFSSGTPLPRRLPRAGREWWQLSQETAQTQFLPQAANSFAHQRNADRVTERPAESVRSTGMQTVHHLRGFPERTACAIDLLEDAYKDLSGFGTPEDEAAALRKVGGDPTYGEILPESFAHVLAAFNGTASDVYYDLGAGIGKTVLQAALTTPVKQALGVEFERSRVLESWTARERLVGALLSVDDVAARYPNTCGKLYAQLAGGEGASEAAVTALDQVVLGRGTEDDEPQAAQPQKEKSEDGRLSKKQTGHHHQESQSMLYNILTSGFSTLFSDDEANEKGTSTEKVLDHDGLLERMQLLQNDFAHADLRNATLVYTCSTCFSEALLSTICEKLPAATLRYFATLANVDSVPACSEKLQHVRTLTLPMTWSSDTHVYLYQPKQP